MTAGACGPYSLNGGSVRDEAQEGEGTLVEDAHGHLGEPGEGRDLGARQLEGDDLLLIPQQLVLDRAALEPHHLFRLCDERVFVGYR